MPYLTGSFPKFVLDERLHVVIVALIQCSKITESTAKWSESRRDALKALTSVCRTVFSEKDMQTGKLQLSQLCCHFCLCKLGGRGGIAVFYFRCRTAGCKLVFGRSCDWPSRHRFYLVSLFLKANAGIVPKIPSCHYMLLM